MYNPDYGDAAWPVSTTPLHTETAGGMHLREEGPRRPPPPPDLPGHPCAWASELGIPNLEMGRLGWAHLLRPMESRPQPQTVPSPGCPTPS